MENSTILIVDDESIGRETLHDMLINQGYTLDFASNGQECLEKAAKIQPDVILLDVMMPEMDGFDVCRKLRQNEASAEVPVILVTALDDRQARLTGIEAGADDFISKPLDRVELRARLKTITRLNRYRRLQSQRAMFGWVVEQAEDGYILLGDDDDIRYANTKARLYLGLPTEATTAPTGCFQELVTPYYQLIPPASWVNWPHPAPENLPTRHLMRPETATTNLLWLKVDRMDMADRLSDGHLIRLTDVTTDIIEDRLRWSFHAQVSHKLKTPLTHLISGIDLLRNDNGGYSDEQRESFLSLIHQSCLQLQSTMRDIFQYLETRDITHPGHTSCTIQGLCSHIEEAKQDLELSSLIIDETACSGLADIEIAISPRAIKLIIWELFRNAKNFHPDQAPDITVQLERFDDEIRVRVGDNGLILSPKQLEQMWYPYYQAERHFTGQVPGMGLGLAVVAAILLDIGGRYQSYNQESGPGVIIDIAIPIVNPLEVNE
ncbi:MAG: response regulator [Chloroflexota bacterium]